MSTRWALILAGVLGVVAAVATRASLEAKKQETERKYETRLIVVAKQDMKKGDVFRKNKGGGKFLPLEYIVQGMIPGSEAGLHEGKILSRDVRRGQPIFTSFLERSKTEIPELTSVVKPEMRAVTLRVDQISGVAGLIKVGDYVDIVGTFEVREGNDRFSRSVYLMQAVPVLALDNRTRGMRGGSKALYRSVTVEVPPWDAVRLVNAQEQGRVQLLLRSPGDVKPGKERQEEQRIHWDMRAELERSLTHSRVPRP